MSIMQPLASMTLCQLMGQVRQNILRCYLDLDEREDPVTTDAAAPYWCDEGDPSP